MVEEELARTNAKMYSKEIERLNNIIKEAIKTLKSNMKDHNYENASISALEILDKESK